MCCPWLEEDLYWFWGQKVKGQGQTWTLNFLPFLHDNSIIFWPTVMILHTYVVHDLRRTPIDFGIKRPKVKVKLGLWIFCHFRMITPLSFGLQSWYFIRMLPMTWGGPLLILGSKGQRSRSNLDFELFYIPHDNFIVFWPTVMILHMYVAHDLRRTPIDFGVQRSKSNMDFEFLAISAW